MSHIEQKPPIQTIIAENSAAFPEESNPLKGEPLSQVFSKDIISSSQTPLSPLQSEQNSVKPLSLIPELTPPPFPLDSLDLSIFKPSSPLSRKRVDLNSLLTPVEISEALLLMNGKTIDAIMLIVFKAQLELEKENANVTEGTHSKYLSFQKLQNTVLEKIKDVLIEDEKVAARLRTGQNIAFAASLISGVAAAAIEYGLLGPVAGFIGSTLGATLQGAFVTAANFIGHYAPHISAGLTLTTSSSQLYYQHQTGQHNADHEIHKHQNRYLSERANDLKGHLSTTIDNQHIFKEAWMRALRRLDRMRKIILSNH